MTEIWVYAEETGPRGELIAGAKSMSDKVVALALGPREEAEMALHQGADEVLWLGECDTIPEDYVDTIWEQLSKHKPAGVFLSASTRNRVIAGRLAARLGTSVLTDVAKVELVDGKLTGSRRVYGGSAIRTEQALSTTTILIVSAGAFPAESIDTGRTGTITEVAFVDPAWQATVKEIREKPLVTVNLPAAKYIVGVGRGIKQQEDLALVQELVTALGAEMGCTRPLAESVNWFPHSQYIGVTGANVKPDIYLALGIAGQVQHMVGVEGAKIIVAVNTDKNAPIFKAADYGIVGDLYQAVPILVEALKMR